MRFFRNWLEQSGFTIIVVIIMTMIVSLFAFNLIELSTSGSKQIKNDYEEELSFNLAEAAMQYIKFELEENRDNLKQKLITVNKGDIVFLAENAGSNLVFKQGLIKADNLYKLNTAVNKLRQKLNLKGTEFYIEEIRVVVPEFLPIPSPEGMKNFSQEKKGKLQISVTARHRKVLKTLKAERQFMIVNTRIPVVSHFSLFIRSLKGNDRVNAFKRVAFYDMQTSTNTEGNNRGFFVQNYLFEDRGDPSKWGFVYIGGGDKLDITKSSEIVAPATANVLNITQGDLACDNYYLNSKGDVVSKSGKDNTSENHLLPIFKQVDETEFNKIPASATSLPDLVVPVSASLLVISPDSILRYLKNIYDGVSGIDVGGLLQTLNFSVLERPDSVYIAALGYAKNPVTLGMNVNILVRNLSGANQWLHVVNFYVKYIQNFYAWALGYTDIYSVPSDDYKSGLDLVSPLAWYKESGDYNVYTTPTIVFGDVYARYHQLGVYVHMPSKAGSTFVFQAVQVLRNLKNWVKAGRPKDEASLKNFTFHKDVFGLVILPSDKAALPIVVGINLIAVDKLFFGFIKKMGLNFLRKWPFKFKDEKFISIAIKMLEKYEKTGVAQPPTKDDIAVKEPSNPLKKKIFKKLFDEGLKAIGKLGKMFTQATLVNKIISIVTKPGFPNFIKEFRMSWNEVISKPGFEFLKKVYNSPKYDVLKSKIVVIPYNKTIEAVAEQCSWEMKSKERILKTKLDKIFKPRNYLIDETMYHEFINDYFKDSDFGEVPEVELSKIDPVKYLESRYNFVIAMNNGAENFDYLKRRFSKQNKFYIDGIIKVDGDLEIPGLSYVLGGILYVNGNVTINGPINRIIREGASKKETFTIFSTKNIYINTSSNITASLIAWGDDKTQTDGNIIGNTYVKIRGNLAAREFALSDTFLSSIRKGGFLRFDKALLRDQFRVNFEPQFSNYKLVNK